MRKPEDELWPVDFPESNATLGGPPDNNHPLRCYRGEGQIVSSWPVPWKLRLKILFGARVWLHVVGTVTQPPVCLTVSKPGPFIRHPETERSHQP